MPISRREWLGLLPVASLAAIGATPGRLHRLLRARQRPLTLNPDRLQPFVDSLQIPPIAVPQRPGHYRVVMRATECQLHRDLPPTSCWTYNGHLPGPTIDARSHQPISVEWVNELPKRHFLPIDHHLDGASRRLPEVRAVVHMHGARVEASSDGYPENWYVPGESRTYRYTNGQEAAALFYHDHAMGINRLNVYAGLFGLMLLRDQTEEDLHLPGGEQEIPLVLCDRLLTPAGQLYYPVSPIPGRPWLPEVFGNLVLVNGKILPELRVEPRTYRFRLLNAANDRFFHLSLSNNQRFYVIGSDQGLLAAPVPLSELLLAPAERSDWMIDFSRHAGQTMRLMNDAQPVMQIRVRASAAAPAWKPPERLRALERIPASAARQRRSLTLDEYDDFAAYPMTMLLDGKYWRQPVSEKPRLGSTEIWSLINTTNDTHPIHLHLVRFQVLDRRPFDMDQFLFDRSLRFVGPALAPAPEEMGWKDTVRAYPGHITRIIVTFEPFAGRYLWHCHVLSHEANDMMRPYDIVAG